MDRLNKDLDGIQIIDELHTNIGIGALHLNHDTFFGGTDMVIRTASGGNGTLLFINTDYTLGDQNTRLSTEAGKSVYTSIRIINPSYQAGNLYFTYKTIGDFVEASDINEAITPPGTIIFIPRTTAPTGYIKANGALLSRTAYAALWAEAQNSGLLVSEAAWVAGRQGCYSTGDGSTTFRIPDLRAEFLRGVDDSRGIDTNRTIGSHQTDAFQGHRHVTQYGFNTTAGSGVEDTIVYDPSSTLDSTHDYMRYTGDPLDSGYGTPRIASETRPVNIALLACIKY